MRVDAHHHLWRYDAAEFDWIDDSMQVLRQDFLLPALKRNMVLADIDATVAVQARQTPEETLWLLDTAERSSTIRGVVGWAPIASPKFPAQLRELCQRPRLKGLRHVVQAEPTGFLDGDAFNKGIACLAPTHLVYDILIHSHQLAEATRFVDRHPNQSFVLDHIAKPRIAARELEPWATDIREIARRGNVTCKLSGMVTEAGWDSWTVQQLVPYFDTVLEAFGPARIMAGSDWPVLTLACDYSRWWKIVAGWLAPLSATERAEIEGGVATKIYRLEAPDLEASDKDPR